MHQFVWARALCGIRYGCPAAVECSGTIQKIHMRKPELHRLTGMHGNMIDFMIRGRLKRISGHFRAQGSALTRNVSSSHGSKNLLQRVTLYRHEKIFLGREDCKPGHKKTIYENVAFFIDFSGCINSFGLAFFCATRIGCCAAVDCSGTIQKINTRKIRVSQGDGHAWKCDGFYDPGTFDKHFGTLQSPWVRADAQCFKITWLEELASDRNTIQAREDISDAGKIAGPDPRKLYVKI